MAQAVIEIRDLVVRYGQTETVNVRTLKLQKREILAVMGPNGAGKSTLLRILGFLEPPTGGEVIFQGRKVGFRPRERLALHRRTAVVFQEPLLLNTTVFRNVALGLTLRGIRKRDESVREWLERFGIAHLCDRQARTLSGGEAQRASLARAFVLDPEVLLLDEPFSALDPPTRDALLADLKSILAETRTTTVFATGIWWQLRSWVVGPRETRRNRSSRRSGPAPSTTAASRPAGLPLRLFHAKAVAPDLERGLCSRR